MRPTLLLTSVLWCLIGCGDPAAEGDDPQPEPGETQRTAGISVGDKTLWWVASSTYTAENCTDAPIQVESFEATRQALGDSYVAFGSTQEGAVDLLRCQTAGQLSTCEPRSPRILYEVAGFEYTRAYDETVPLDDVDCEILLHDEVVLTDAGDTMVERLKRAYSLRGSECYDFNEAIRVASPNDQGLEGCVLTYRSPMSLRDWSPR